MLRHEVNLARAFRSSRSSRPSTSARAATVRHRRAEPRRANWFRAADLPRRSPPSGLITPRHPSPARARDGLLLTVRRSTCSRLVAILGTSAWRRGPVRTREDQSRSGGGTQSGRLLVAVSPASSPAISRGQTAASGGLATAQQSDGSRTVGHTAAARWPIFLLMRRRTS